MLSVSRISEAGITTAGFLRTRIEYPEFQIGSLESGKIIIWSLKSEKIESLESEKSDPYRSIPGT